MVKAKILAAHRNNNLTWILFFLAVLLFFIVATKAFAKANASFILEPAKKTLASGDELILTVSLDTGQGNKTNSYIASLSYPEDQLEFVSIDTSKSPFNMALEAKGGDGKVTIMRGTTEAQSGKALVGTVKFKAKTSTSSDRVTVSNNSAIISSLDNTNILPGSTVQNSPNTVTERAKNPMGQIGEKLSAILGIFGWIKNFFSSFFK